MSVSSKVYATLRLILEGHLEKVIRNPKAEEGKEGEGK